MALIIFQTLTCSYNNKIYGFKKKLNAAQKGGILHHDVHLTLKNLDDGRLDD